MLFINIFFHKLLNAFCANVSFKSLKFTLSNPMHSDIVYLSVYLFD